MTWQQREELHHVLNYLSSPCRSPEEWYKRVAINCYLNGEDALAKLCETLPEFVALRFTDKARVFLNNERAKRRNRAKEILEHRNRLRNAREFTSENYRVTMGYSQNRNYGMAEVSIYSVVEIWQDQDTVEKEYLINFSDYKTKDWLTRLLVWALMNKREVLLKPASPEEMGSMKMFVPKDKLVTAA